MQLSDAVNSLQAMRELSHLPGDVVSSVCVAMATGVITTILPDILLTFVIVCPAVDMTLLRDINAVVSLLTFLLVLFYSSFNRWRCCFTNTIYSIAAANRRVRVSTKVAESCVIIQRLLPSIGT